MMEILLKILYKTLSGCMIDNIVIENIGISAYSLSRTTSKQDELLERIGLKKLISIKERKKIKSFA